MNNKKQLIINMIANITTFMVGLGINLLFTPYLIRTVGREAYGFMPLANNIISYLTIISTALNSMTGRFIVMSIYDDDEQTTNKYFTTVFFSNIIMTIVFSIIFIIIVMFLDKIFNIPQEIIFDIRILFLLTFISCLITLIGSVFSVATFVKNRLDIKSGVAMFESILKVVVLLILFSIFKPNIYFIGIVILIITVITNSFNIYITKKLLPQIRISKKYFDKKVINVLVGSGMWNSVTQTGSILLTGFDLLLANMFLGASEAAYIAIAKTIPNLIWTLSATITAVFTPQFTILYAENKKENLLKEIKISLKILGIFLGIPLAGFVVFGEEFYRLWIPNENTRLIYILTVVTLIPNFVDVFVGTLNNIFGMVNKVKLPAIMILATGVFNLLVVLILLNIIPQWSMYIICGVSGVFAVIRLLFFVPIYSAKCLEIEWYTFYPQIVKSILCIVINIAIMLVFKINSSINTWLALIFICLSSGCISLVSSYFIMLNRNERKTLIRKLRKNK